MNQKKTLVLGATTKPERYAYLAAEMLHKKGYTIELLGNKPGKIGENTIKTTLENISDIDTVTMYLSETNQLAYEDFILNLRPNRVIFNPGAENNKFAYKLKAENIEVLEACTLVLLSTGQY